MRVESIGDELGQLLAEAGVDPDHLDLRRTWEVFKRFAALPVDGVNAQDDGDRLVYETRVGRATPRSSADEERPDRFEILIDRQLYLTDDDGNYEGGRVLTVTVQFEPTPELEAFANEQVSGRGGPPSKLEEHEAAAAWARDVEAQPGFGLALERYKPVDGFMTYGPM